MVFDVVDESDDVAIIESLEATDSEAAANEEDW